MSLLSLLRDPVLAPQLEKEIDLRAQKAAWRFNVPADVLFQIYSQTVVLDETDEPKDIQLRRIKESGFTDDDIYFAPSVDEAIEVLGKELALKLFTEEFSELRRRYETDKFLTDVIPPIMTYTEWGQTVRRYIEFLKQEKVALSSIGYSKNLPEISFLLGAAPKGFLINFNKIKLAANEIQGKNFDELKGMVEHFEEQSDLSDLSPAYREILVPLYSDTLNLIYDQSIKDGSQLSRHVAKLIFKYFPDIDDVFSIKEIEEQVLRTFDGRVDDEVDYDEIDPSILDNEYLLPFAFQNLIHFVCLAYFELQTHLMTKVRTTSALRTTKTALSYPLFDISFNFSLWKENSNDREITFKILDEIARAFQELEQTTSTFIRDCVSCLRELYFVPVTAKPAFQTPATDLNPPKKLESAKDLDPSKDRPETEYKIGDSEFVFAEDFQVLKWRDRVWNFKKWECEIVKEFYHANRRHDSVTSGFIDDQAYEAHYKDNARASSRVKTDKKKKGYTYLGTNKEVRPKYYLWKHVFQSNQDLRQTFIVSDEINPGEYKLNPKWNPEVESKNVLPKRSRSTKAQ